jgi:hypothetical protein
MKKIQTKGSGKGIGIVVVVVFYVVGAILIF